MGCDCHNANTGAGGSKLKKGVESAQSKSKSQGKWQPLWQVCPSIGVRLYGGGAANYTLHAVQCQTAGVNFLMLVLSLYGLLP